MAASRTVDWRWIRRYRVFFALASVFFLMQIFLALKFFRTNSEITSVEDDILSGGEPEVFKNKPHKSRHKDPYDDEDSSNKVHTAITRKVVAPANNSGLQLEDLDFVPQCKVTIPEAISAIHRARTQQCKRELVNVACLSQQQKLYAKRLPNYCPSQGRMAGKSLGCYRDQKNMRILNGYFANLKLTNSPQQCIDLCLQSGFQYAGVQYGTECFCGDERPMAKIHLPDTHCDKKCPADTTKDCGGYFAIHVFETGLSGVKPPPPGSIPKHDEPPARVAFILTVNGRAVRQVRRLLKALYHVRHYFYIHVDARQDYLFRELLTLERQFTNVKLTRNRLSTIWGGASLLKILLQCMKSLLEESDWQWDFVINLSESDMPIKSNEELVSFLTANKGRNFVKSHGREVQRFVQKQGLDKTFYECETHMWKIGSRQLPWGVQMDGGSDWVALSRSFVDYAVHEEDELVTGLKTVFQYTLLPAEAFFHVLLRNSKFCQTYVDNNLHVTNWKRRLGCKCQYKQVVDWCGCSPNDFRPEDWPRLQGTELRQLYFARKFEPLVNQAVILQLEEWLYGPYPYDSLTLHSYWQNIYHYADLSPPSDDALVTIANSLARTHVQQLNCGLKFAIVLQITSYHHFDVYKGTLLAYEAKAEDGTSVRIEVWVKPIRHFRLLGPGAGRLTTLSVSTEYDQKEQLLRNTFRAMGPFCEPALLHQWAPGETVNVTFLWVDPTNVIAQASDVTVKEGASINVVKTALRQPLRPGVWTVKFVHNGSVSAEDKFLVTPLEVMSNAEITQQQTGLIHDGPAGGASYGNPERQDLDQFVDIEQRPFLQRRAASNAQKFGDDLQRWIDGLTAKFYKILNACIIVVDQAVGVPKLDPCHKTSWSSQAADPKSEIRGVVNRTGRLVR